jgi:ACT domain-containing protein
MSKVLDKIYRLVKEKRHVDIVTFCDLLDLSPSTFYNYRKFVTTRYKNIIYENGAFKWIDTEDFEVHVQSNQLGESINVS